MSLGILIEARALELSPQDVVDFSLKSSLKVKQTELSAAKTEATAEKSRGAYDLIMKLAPTYEYTEAQTLTGAGNPVDRTWTVLASLTKKMSTGTTLGLEYNRVSQSSTLSSFTASLRSENAALDSLTLSLRQPLLQDAFGEADRATLESADATTMAARLQREESLEDLILSSLSLYWKAYVAETQLRENSSARLKYEELVKAVRRKAGYNLSSPGELPRLEAEFESADTRVKTSSEQYLRALDNLKTALQLDPKENVTFKSSAQLASEIPPIPKLPEVSQEKLRPVVLAKINLENAARSRTVAVSSSRPKLDFVGRARTTGVDQTSDQSFSKMTSASKPTYSVGLELEWPLDSALYRGMREEASAGYAVAELDFKSALDTVRDQLAAAERLASANRDNALSSIQIVSKRTQVVKELEASYRQGRTPLVELIRAYNDLFTSQQDRANAVGNYMISLNQWAAARDELVKKGEKR